MLFEISLKYLANGIFFDLFIPYQIALKMFYSLLRILTFIDFISICISICVYCYHV